MNLISNITIIPRPVSISISSGKFTLTDETIIFSDQNLLGISNFLKNLIYNATGFNIDIREYKGSTDVIKNSIILHISEDSSNLGTEGYLISISPLEVKISAKNPAGIFYGIQTLRQLLPVEIESKNFIDNVEWEIQCLKIKDFPRFSWRGYMLDEGRHFHGKEVVKRILDLMALLKMNIFHWHLTEDQGWRIQIKNYPKLTEIGSKREETQIGGRLSKKRDGIPHSGYYSQEDIQDIIEYAKDRFITIIPEIDMPGHTRAALASYPHLSCKGYPFRVSTHWGFHKDVMCVGKEEVFEFIQGVLNEIIELFPSNIIHIGGDEVLKERWKECPDCQKRLKTEGFNDVNELETYFINRLSAYLKSRGKKVICWNDVLNENLTENIICQYWFRRKKRVIEHVKKGGNVIMSNFKFTYLDHSYSFTPLKMAYKFEPIPKNLDQKYHKYVLGLEAPMWGEYTPNIKRLEWQTFPRLIAFSEIGWTPKDKRDFSLFRNHLNHFLKRFDIIGINYAKSKEVKKNIFKRLFKVFTLVTEEKGGI
ncbi:MAG: beta-N-acetylhexosaminidase [Promethearchaeota archaeon]